MSSMMNLVLVFVLVSIVSMGGKCSKEIGSGPWRSTKLKSDMTISMVNCTKSTDEASITSLKYSPNPPLLGQNISMTVNGIIKSETIKQGSNFTLTAKYGDIQVLDGVYPLCGISTIKLPDGFGYITLIGISCPQTKGSLSITQTIILPIDSPIGNYYINMIAFDQLKQELMCLDVTVAIVPQ